MPRIVVNMRNLVFSDAVCKALDANGDFAVVPVEIPENVADECATIRANIVLLEVMERPGWTLPDRLILRKEIRKTTPLCKIVLLVDEKSEKHTARKIKQAKKDGLIDQFIFASCSSDFMAALLETL